MKKVKFKFDLGELVGIPELQRLGHVISLIYTDTGNQYGVRYFDNAEAHVVNFYEFELETPIFEEEEKKDENQFAIKS